MADVYEKVGKRYRKLVGYHEGHAMHSWMPEGWMPGPDDEIHDSSQRADEALAQSEKRD